MSKIKFNISNPFKERWEWAKIDSVGKAFIIGIIALFTTILIIELW